MPRLTDVEVPLRRITSSLPVRLADERTAPEGWVEPERPVTTRTDELRVVEPLPARVAVVLCRDVEAEPRPMVLSVCKPRRVEAISAWRSLCMGREPGVTPPHPGPG